MTSSKPSWLPKVVGLTGKAGVGKDTLADFLVEQHGFVKYSLAAPLKGALNLMFGFTPEMWDDRAWKETEVRWIGLSPRQLAQTLGTEWGRQCVSHDIWLRIAEKRIEKLLDDGVPGVVIADVRFDNEAEFVKQFGGFVYRIERPGTDEVSAHCSEEGVSEWIVDFVLHNDDSVSNLYSALKASIPHNLIRN